MKPAQPSGWGVRLYTAHRPSQTADPQPSIWPKLAIRRVLLIKPADAAPLNAVLGVCFPLRFPVQSWSAI
jgi:hypothetical protein